MRQQSRPRSATSAGHLRVEPERATRRSRSSRRRRARLGHGRLGRVDRDARARRRPRAARSPARTRRAPRPRSTGSAPGRVDSPPTSRMSAPSAASSRPCSTAASASRNSPPSENESGVTLTTPMMTGGCTGAVSPPGSAIFALYSLWCLDDGVRAHLQRSDDRQHRHCHLACARRSAGGPRSSDRDGAAASPGRDRKGVVHGNHHSASERRSSATRRTASRRRVIGRSEAARVHA